MRLLAFAYACEPIEGSEPGAGWMWARMLARHADTWVITRSNNREPIEAAIDETPERGTLHFVYVDLPTWARFWKRGSRGLRLYYLLWQMAALRSARRLHEADRFDLVWHLTLANAWLGSSAALVGPRFVLGPVGGGVAPPWSLIWATGVRSMISEVMRGAGRVVGRYVNPLARLAWRRADVVLVQNPETVAWLPRKHRIRARVFPNVVFAGETLDDGSSAGERPRTALFVGRLLAWKGADLVKQKRATVGLDDPADAFGEGARECAGHVAEQLALNDVCCHGLAVDLHEWALGAEAGGMDGPRECLLAGSGLAHDQDRQAITRGLCGDGKRCAEIG